MEKIPSDAVCDNWGYFLRVPASLTSTGQNFYTFPFTVAYIFSVSNITTILYTFSGYYLVVQTRNYRRADNNTTYSGVYL